MAEIKVTSDTLIQKSSTLHTGNESVQQELLRLKGEIDALISGEWAGAGSASFNTLYTEFDNAGRQLGEALNGIATQLAEAARVYQETEDNVAAAFAR